MQWRKEIKQSSIHIILCIGHCAAAWIPHLDSAIGSGAVDREWWACPLSPSAPRRSWDFFLSLKGLRQRGEFIPRQSCATSWLGGGGGGASSSSFNPKPIPSSQPNVLCCQGHSLAFWGQHVCSALSQICIEVLGSKVIQGEGQVSLLSNKTRTKSRVPPCLTFHVYMARCTWRQHQTDSTKGNLKYIFLVRGSHPWPKTEKGINGFLTMCWQLKIFG